MTKNNASAVEAGAIAVAAFVVPVAILWSLWVLAASIGGGQ